ncbi:hypothetical protein T12_1767 [Trichinella patagoniensis]|uniref:Uncharacterized protein n=1 Tax=Trichinella patagoniensis TaxID=990121 RepID=A0A0V0Z3N2_9BILA|nr:hypothetical protein T12_1767 [Trichinella patagoniensis]
MDAEMDSVTTNTGVIEKYTMKQEGSTLMVAEILHEAKAVGADSEQLLHIAILPRVQGICGGVGPSLRSMLPVLTCVSTRRYQWRAFCVLPTPRPSLRWSGEPSWTMPSLDSQLGTNGF